MAGNVDFLGGLLMGIASSLHCAGLCGGIASSLLIGAPGPRTARSRAGTLLAHQLGRVIAYTSMGAIAGSLSAGFSGLLALAGIQPLLRLAAAAVLLWSGLAIAGFLQGFSRLDGLIPRAALAVRGAALGPKAFAVGAPILSGLMWGLAPCGMVYGALLNAALSGSALSGLLFMAGFGIATIPPVALTAMGAGTLTAMRSAHAGSALTRWIVGIGMAALGLLSLLEPAMEISSLCR